MAPPGTQSLRPLFFWAGWVLSRVNFLREWKALFWLRSLQRKDVIITCVPSNWKDRLKRDRSGLAAIHPHHHSRIISSRADLRQLSECVHLPHAARSFSRRAALGLSAMQSAHSRLRQYSSPELDFAPRTLPRLQSPHLTTLCNR